MLTPDGCFERGSTNSGPGATGTGGNAPRTDAGVALAPDPGCASDTPATWEQTAYLKASNTDAGDVFGGVFGGIVIGIQHTISLSADGNTLAVGAFREASGTGAESDDSAINAGAVYVFTRNASGASFVWSQQSYIKAGNPDAHDGFGASVSLSADGNPLWDAVLRVKQRGALM